MQSKVFMITGGAKRVGAVTCRRLHDQGANLVIHYRSSKAAAQALQNELNQKRPDSVQLLQAELQDIATFPNMIDQVANYFGRLDGLINNASSFFPTPIGACDAEAWEDLVGSNMKAPLFLSQAAAPYIKKQRGCIINIVDIHADRPLKGFVIYSSAKGGLKTLTRSLALELAPEIRVNGISPGPILWPEEKALTNHSARQKIIDTTPLQRTGEPDDIAKAVQFFIADAPYITGQIIAVDGGRSIHL